MKLSKKFSLGVTALAAIALPTASNAVFVDLSGIAVDGGTPSVIIVEEDEFLTDPFEIFYSFNLYHFGTSWGSETDISLYNFWLNNPGGTVEISGEEDCGFGNSGGAFTCAGVASVVSPLIWPGNQWMITLSDSFNDSVNPDYVFGEGSYLAWGDDSPTSTNVPEPSTLLLMGAGIIGFGLTRMRKTQD
jgi:hypothetical protein